MKALSYYFDVFDELNKSAYGQQGRLLDLLRSARCSGEIKTAFTAAAAAYLRQGMQQGIEDAVKG